VPNSHEIERKQRGRSGPEFERKLQATDHLQEMERKLRAARNARGGQQRRFQVRMHDAQNEIKELRAQLLSYKFKNQELDRILGVDEPPQSAPENLVSTAGKKHEAEHARPSPTRTGWQEQTSMLAEHELSLATRQRSPLQQRHSPNSSPAISSPAARPPAEPWSDAASQTEERRREEQHRLRQEQEDRLRQEQQDRLRQEQEDRLRQEKEDCLRQKEEDRRRNAAARTVQTTRRGQVARGEMQARRRQRDQLVAEQQAKAATSLQAASRGRDGRRQARIQRDAKIARDQAEAAAAAQAARSAINPFGGGGKKKKGLFGGGGGGLGTAAAKPQLMPSAAKPSIGLPAWKPVVDTTVAPAVSAPALLNPDKSTADDASVPGFTGLDRPAVSAPQQSVPAATSHVPQAQLAVQAQQAALGRPGRRGRRMMLDVEPDKVPESGYVPSAAGASGYTPSFGDDAKKPAAAGSSSPPPGSPPPVSPAEEADGGSLAGVLAAARAEMSAPPPAAAPVGTVVKPMGDVSQPAVVRAAGGAMATSSSALSRPGSCGGGGAKMVSEPFGTPTANGNGAQRFDHIGGYNLGPAPLGQIGQHKVPEHSTGITPPQQPPLLFASQKPPLGDLSHRLPERTLGRRRASSPDALPELSDGIPSLDEKPSAPTKGLGIRTSELQAPSFEEMDDDELAAEEAAFLERMRQTEKERAPPTKPALPDSGPTPPAMHRATPPGPTKRHGNYNPPDESVRGGNFHGPRLASPDNIIDDLGDLSEEEIC